MLKHEDSSQFAGVRQTGIDDSLNRVISGGGDPMIKVWQ